MALVLDPLHLAMAASLQLSTATTGDLSADDKDEIVALCTRAFEEDFSSLFHFVQAADHVVAYLDGRLVGHAVWSTRWLQTEGTELLRTAYVDAVATDPDLWGRGIGSAVIERLAEETAGYDLRALSTDRPTFYERLGWQRWLGPIAVRKEDEIVPTPDETVLIRPTPRSPHIDHRSLLTAEWRGGQPW
jgi:aminoglycoside 2'-N-acetyltransferase I